MDYKKLIMYGSIAASSLLYGCGDGKIGLKGEVTEEYGPVNTTDGKKLYGIKLFIKQKPSEMEKGEKRFLFVPVAFNKLAEPIDNFIEKGDSVEVMVPKNYKKVLKDLEESVKELEAEGQQISSFPYYMLLEPKDLVRAKDMKDKNLHYFLGITH